MDTIKAILVRKFQQKKNGYEEIADYIVREEVLRLLKDICCTFPNGTHEGQEFAEIMNNFQVIGDPKAHRMLVGKEVDTIVDKAINALVDTIMNEPDNLDYEYCAGYTNIRSLLVNAIDNGR